MSLLDYTNVEITCLKITWCSPNRPFFICIKKGKLLHFVGMIFPFGVVCAQAVVLVRVHK